MQNVTPSEHSGLLLFPNLIADHPRHQSFFPESVDEAVITIDGLIAESVGAGRRFLGRFKTPKPAHLIPIALLNEHTRPDEFDFLLEPLLKGERWGLISDSGLPCIADPGAHLVRRAHQKGIPVSTFVGPCSILMALMLSGFSGQQFTFHGYISKDKQQRQRQMQEMEKVACSAGYTQIFMQAPYRNTETLEELIRCLSDTSKLCVVWDLTLPTEGVIMQTILQWKTTILPALEKRNALFLIGT